MDTIRYKSHLGRMFSEDEDGHKGKEQVVLPKKKERERKKVQSLQKAIENAGVMQRCVSMDLSSCNCYPATLLSPSASLLITVIGRCQGPMACSSIPSTEDAENQIV